MLALQMIFVDTTDYVGMLNLEKKILSWHVKCAENLN